MVLVELLRRPLARELGVYPISLAVSRTSLRVSSLTRGLLLRALETVEKEIEEEVIVRAVEKATGEKMVAEAIKNGMAAKASFDKYGIM